MTSQLNIKNIRSRYAPTPSGHLHIGNIYNFLITWVLTKKNQGEILLRIDDIDGTRVRDQYLVDIFESLEWLDLEYDLGPTDIDDFKKNYSQLNLKDYYFSKLNQLEDLIYACDCSRSKVKSMYTNNIYQGHCKNKNKDFIEEENALRISVDPIYHLNKVNLYEKMGDFIIWRKDNYPSYQLVSLLDDEKYKINFIVRGVDLIDSTCAQSYIAKLLNLSFFRSSNFIYHDLITDQNGDKLSKSNGSLSINHIKLSKKPPSFVYNEIARNIGIKNWKDYKQKEDFLRSDEFEKLIIKSS